MSAKTCPRCATLKPLDDFHRNGKYRASWCKPCFNTHARKRRKRTYTAEQKRRWHLATRYQITPADVDALRAAQAELCAICECALPEKFHIDHCHTTGVVRGLLCHRCNILLHAIDNADFFARATAYLRRAAQPNRAAA